MQKALAIPVTDLEELQQAAGIIWIVLFQFDSVRLRYGTTAGMDENLCRLPYEENVKKSIYYHFRTLRCHL
jgi:hypothetical protein